MPSEQFFQFGRECIDEKLHPPVPIVLVGIADEKIVLAARHVGHTSKDLQYSLTPSARSLTFIRSPPRLRRSCRWSTFPSTPARIPSWRSGGSDALPLSRGARRGRVSELPAPCEPSARSRALRSAPWESANLLLP